MFGADHRPRLRVGPNTAVRFDRSRLPAGYFLFSDFGALRIADDYGLKPITQSGTIPFGPSSAGLGLAWANASATATIDYATFAIPAQFTMEALFRVGTVQAENVCTFANANGTDLGVFDRQIAVLASGLIQFYVFTGTTSYLTSTTAFATGDIVHALATYDGTTYRLYINGVQEASATLGAAYGGYFQPVLHCGYANTSVAGSGVLRLPTLTLLTAGMANRALSADEVLLRSLSPWAPSVVLRDYAKGPISPFDAEISGTVDVTGSVTAEMALGATIAGDVSVTGSATAALAVAATIAGEISITGAFAAQFSAAGTDTHDGWLKRSRRQRAIDAALRREDEERQADARALKLSLDAALGMAAEIVADAPEEAAEAVQNAVLNAVRYSPIIEQPRVSAETLAAVRDVIAAMQAAIAEANRLRDLADDDEDVELLLRAL